MKETRRYWVHMLTKLANPVLTNFKNGTLKKNLVLEASEEIRESYKGLEILGRTLAGLAPWIETPAIDPEEETLRAEYAALAREAVAAATDEASPDFCIFGSGQKQWNVQYLVDAAYLALALVRAPHELCEKLPDNVRKNLAECFRTTRNIRAVYNNWVLFSAMVEAGLFVMGEDYDIVRIDYALRQMEQWYAGDGFYKDGPTFALDYYNSFAIQPMLAVLADKFADSYAASNHIYSPGEPVGKKMRRLITKRFVRYARIQEMMIAPDGSYPPVGRSLVYRCGAFQALAQAALWEMLPEEVTPAMARCALTKVIKKTLEAKDTFREDGWLNIGVCGHQRNICESYITTASLYMATLAFLPLGLDESKPFWSTPDEPTTWERVYGGENRRGDHSLNGDVKMY